MEGSVVNAAEYNVIVAGAKRLESQWSYEIIAARERKRQPVDTERRESFDRRIERWIKSTVPSPRITTDCRGSLWAIYGDGDDRQADIRKPDSRGSSATLLEASTRLEASGEPPRFPNSLTYGRIYWRR